MESGMEIAMMSVLRQLPKNSRIIRAVSAAAITASRMTPETAARTKIALILQGLILRLRGNGQGDAGQQPANAFHHTQGGCVPGLEHDDQHAAVAVLARDVGLE